MEPSVSVFPARLVFQHLRLRMMKCMSILLYPVTRWKYVLYGCEHGLSPQKEHTPRVFENSVPRRICEHRRWKEVAGQRRELHKPNEKLLNLYFSQNVTRAMKTSRMRWTGHVACMREIRYAYKMLLWPPEGKRPLGSASVWELRTSIYRRKGLIVRTGFMSLGEPPDSTWGESLGTSWEMISFSSRGVTDRSQVLW
jgi:hypothetical protein